MKAPLHFTLKLFLRKQERKSIDSKIVPKIFLIFSCILEKIFQTKYVISKRQRGTETSQPLLPHQPQQILEVSIMDNSKLARIQCISQDLTYHFYDINYHISRAWHRLESARGNLSSLQLLYDEWLADEKLSEKEQKVFNEEKMGSRDYPAFHLLFMKSLLFKSSPWL